MLFMEVVRFLTKRGIQANSIDDVVSLLHFVKTETTLGWYILEGYVAGKYHKPPPYMSRKRA